MPFCLLFLFILSSAWANPVVIPANVDHLYIPEGFDSNDSVEVVVTGTLPDLCHSRHKVETHIQGKVIHLSVTSILQGGTKSCPPLIVPFKEVVTLGQLPDGDYRVHVNEGTPYFLKKKLSIVEAANSAIDNYIYPAIEWVERKSDDSFVLHGWRYSPCFELDDIKVVSNKIDTLSILPVMKQTSDFCPMKGIPVSYPMKLSLAGLRSQKVLLHIRTMDGKSVNTIVGPLAPFK
jgi:hypothetical protein